MGLPLLGPKLLDQREDVPVVFLQKLLQVLTILGLHLVFSDRPCRSELLVDLAVQLLAIRHDQEGPVACDLPEDLLRKKDHREALTAPLRMPKNAEAALVRL